MCKVNMDTAESELLRFADAMGLDLDESVIEADDLESFQIQQRVILKAMCSGSLVISEQGEAVYTPVRGDDHTPLTFHEPRGDTMASVDKQKQGHNHAMMHTFLGAITRTHAAKFAKMSNADLKVCRALSSFLAAG